MKCTGCGQIIKMKKYIKLEYGTEKYYFHYLKCLHMWVEPVSIPNNDFFNSQMGLPYQAKEKKMNFKDFMKIMSTFALIVFVLCILAGSLYLIITNDWQYNLEEIIRQQIGYILIICGIASLLISGVFDKLGK